VSRFLPCSRRKRDLGAVIDVYMRYTRQVLEQNFPVFCMGCDAQGSLYRNQVIRHNCPVEIGNIHINPSDLIFGDINGVVIIPKEIEEKAISITLAKVRGEKDTREAIKKGMLAVNAVDNFGEFLKKRLLITIQIIFNGRIAKKETAVEICLAVLIKSSNYERLLQP
jgi:hypothetical protein